jgi:hypothetical protein
LALDGTTEETQHLLVASVSVGRRALPLYWRAYHDAELKKRISRYEREFVRTLFADVLCGVARRRFVLTADRWFADVDLLDLLNESHQHLIYVIEHRHQDLLNFRTKKKERPKRKSKP